MGLIISIISAIYVAAQEHFEPISFRLLVRSNWVLAPTRELPAELPSKEDGLRTITSVIAKQALLPQIFEKGRCFSGFFYFSSSAALLSAS